MVAVVRSTRAHCRLCGAKRRCRVCDLVFLCGWLGCAPVLVDQSAEDSVASDRSIEGNDGGRIVGRRVLVKPLVRPVVIEMAHVLVETVRPCRSR